MMEEATVRTKKKAEASSNNLCRGPRQPSLDHSTIPLVAPSPCKRSRQPPVRFSEEQWANPETEAVDDDTITPKSKKSRSGTRESGSCGSSFKCKKCQLPYNAKGPNFRRMRSHPSDPLGNASAAELLTHKIRLFYRQESTDRVGLGRNNTESDLRVCTLHEFETVETCVEIKHGGYIHSQKIELKIVTGAGTKSSLSASESNKGVSYDRYHQREGNLLRMEKKKLFMASALGANAKETVLERHNRLRNAAEGEAAETKLVLQQTVECNFEDDDKCMPMNLMTAKAFGMIPPKEGLKREFGLRRVGKPTKRKLSGDDSQPKKVWNEYGRKDILPPKFLPSTMKTKDVKRKTGFKDVETLLAYAIVVCNGDLNLLQNRCSILTWFEEWVLYFEWSYGYSNIRLQDLVGEWGIDKTYVTNIKDCKGALEVAALRSWPRFASYDEDMSLRNQSKWAKYDGHRPIMWDMTNVSAYKFTDGAVQRGTYSSYYGENCFKGGVFCQLCGWLGNEDLWGGGVSDSDYNNNSGYLEEQLRFQESNYVDGLIIKFLNILDRGYRGKWAAWKCGRQVALQPPSSKSDRRFTGKQTRFAGSVARDRGGNERAVRICKRSGLFQRGFQPGMSATHLNNAWRAFGFRANFMYEPVL